MVHIKEQRVKEKEVMFIGRYIKSFVDFVNHSLIISLSPLNVRFYISFSVFDDVYPKEDVRYYDSQVFSSFMEFIKDPLRNIKVRISTHGKGDLFFTTLDVEDLSSRKRAIPVRMDVDVEFSPQDIENLHVFYDDLRDAIVVKGKKGNENITILLGLPLHSVDHSWEYEKNIKITEEKKIRKHVASFYTTLSSSYPSFTFILTDNYDAYDSSYYHLSVLPEKKKVFECEDVKFSYVYNVIYSYLDSALFTHKFYELMREFYLYGKDIKKVKNLSLPHSLIPFWKDMQKKKVEWMKLADERILGRSFLHTLLLANKLIDQEDYKEAFSLLRSFSHAFYDVLSTASIDRIEYEKDFVLLFFLFIRSFHKIFLNFEIKGKRIWWSFYIPFSFSFSSFSYDSLSFKEIKVSKEKEKCEILLSFYSSTSLTHLFVKPISSFSISYSKLPISQTSNFYSSHGFITLK